MIITPINIAKGLKYGALASALALSGCKISIDMVGSGELQASSGAGCLDTVSSALGSLPNNLAYGVECENTYLSTAPVTFTPVPKDGFVFYGWSEACEGQETCVIRPPGYGGEMKTLVAFFYPAAVAAKLDELAIEDVWARHCIAEAMIDADTTDLATIDSAQCDVGHPRAATAVIDVAELSLLPQLNSLDMGIVGSASPTRPVVSISDWSAFNNLENLETLRLEYAAINLEALPNLPVSHLKLFSSDIESFAFLSNMPQLEAFTFEYHPNYADIISDESLNLLTTLTHLKHIGIQAAALDLTRLPNLPHLESLDVIKNDLEDISELSRFTHLKALDIGYNYTLENIDVVSQFSNVEKLGLEKLWGYTGDLSEISALTNLTHLSLNASKNIPSIAGIANLNKLQSFSASSVATSDLSPLANKPDLEVVYLSLTGDGDTPLDLSVFATNSYPKLTHLTIGHSAVEDVTPLGVNAFPALVDLTLWGNPFSDISNFSASNFPSLAHLRLDSTNVGDISPLLDFTQLQTLSISNAVNLEDVYTCEERDQLIAALPDTEVTGFCKR